LGVCRTPAQTAKTPRFEDYQVLGICKGRVKPLNLADPKPYEGSAEERCVPLDRQPLCSDSAGNRDSVPTQKLIGELSGSSGAGFPVCRRLSDGEPVENRLQPGLAAPPKSFANNVKRMRVASLAGLRHTEIA
jgi:hypothetical protein